MQSTVAMSELQQVPTYKYIQTNYLWHLLEKESLEIKIWKWMTEGAKKYMRHISSSSTIKWPYIVEA